MAASLPKSSIKGIGYSTLSIVFSVSINDDRMALIRLLSDRIERGNTTISRDKLIAFMLERNGINEQMAQTFVGLMDTDGGGEMIDIQLAHDQLHVS
jgi:hypothetical protein